MEPSAGVGFNWSMELSAGVGFNWDMGLVLGWAIIGIWDRCGMG